MFGKSKKKKHLNVDGIAQIVVGSSFLLKSNIRQFKELDGGVVIFASLEKHFSGHEICVEEYKVIVEPPRLLERLMGITLESKINKAIAKIKDQVKEFIICEPKSELLSRLQEYFPKFLAFVI